MVLRELAGFSMYLFWNNIRLTSYYPCDDVISGQLGLPLLFGWSQGFVPMQPWFQSLGFAAGGAAGRSPPIRQLVARLQKHTS